MEWSSSEKNYGRKNVNNVRRSVSTIGFHTAFSNLTLREARSFTGALEELRACNRSTSVCDAEHVSPVRPDEHCKESEGAENGYVTKEILSDQVYVVKDEMLTYRGRKYSLNDIATRWKKDCRMWLWKNKFCKKKNRSVGEIREKLQNLKLPNRT
ncbi:hypothetical protein Trydic_g5696 [Trypoxylus dichotomus]